jgi:hypothetical protein
LQVKQDPNPDPDPKLRGKWDPDPKKLVSDPQHWGQMYKGLFKQYKMKPFAAPA